MIDVQNSSSLAIPLPTCKIYGSDRFFEKIKGSGLPTLSVDIPSGWDVNKGDIHNTAFLPQGVISYA